MMPPHKLPPPANGVMKGPASTNNDVRQNQPQQQPTMARNASAGDTQPSLPPGALPGLSAPPVTHGLSFGAGGANGGAVESAKGAVASGTSDQADVAASHASASASGVPTGPSFQGRFSAPRNYMDMASHVPGAAISQAAPVVSSAAPRSIGAPPKGDESQPTATSASSSLHAQPQPQSSITTGTTPSVGSRQLASAAARPQPAPPGAERSAPAAAPRPAPAAGGGGMRELRVEDALLYLDDVKREFGDRPRVYNEFLAIMKNFKSQEVDTPGVIARVSKLFRGYNNLILGFNKFLPDGYKISLEDLVEQDRIRAEQARHQLAAATAAARPSTSVVPSVANPPQPPPQATVGYPHQQPQATQHGHPAAQPLQHKPANPRGSASSPQFGLSARKGPPPKGPPMRVPQMRKSPPGSEKVDHRPQPQQPPQSLSAPTRPGMKASPPALPIHKPAAQSRPAGQPPLHQPPSRSQPQKSQIQPRQQAAAAVPAPQPAQPQHQAVEFDHAISYVTTIKRRFSSDPSTYHAFLEILHTYQKEQRGIKEVLEQVAHLFQDHPDLLKEFTFFLPDAIQEQAKERLHRAAADSEARIAAERARLEQQEQGQLQHATESEQHQHQIHEMDVEYTGKGLDGHQKFIDMTGTQQALAAEPEAPSRGRKRPIAEANSKGVQPVPMTLPQQPETFVYNSAVERQFFDAAREALASYSRDGGQAWAEFLKCLDMYAQEILSRSEMLNFVEPLLGKRNTKLFEEFKRILAAAGAQQGSVPSMEDSWHSVPLSEIDFSRCRRCSPSYRALPRDYPAPPCSERSDEESKVLNDVWVSLPVGSEESYTFRHMRRNTYEEILFRCEDERFEIDMVIDSNIATLHRLEPLAEEIAKLAQEELIIPDNSNIPKPASEGTGMGGRRFRYIFDKNILGVIHRNSIARIYGDAGPEMLDLLVKNPTVAIPVVVQRLRQKDKEWRVVRERLNRRWKELVEQNYYRSLDHRSLTWRTTDKRAISTRTLVAEIKDRAAHGGNEGQAALQARLDKAKEEHGTFYEVTMGEAMSRKLDLTFLPKPDRRLFSPHLSMMYENNHWAQRDAYRILAFALERGNNISPADKERCHRLWTDFFGPWFGLSLTWMQHPAIAFLENSIGRSGGDINHHAMVSNGGDESVVEEEDDESMASDTDLGGANVVTEDARKLKARHEHDGSPSATDHHSFPVGATVSTVYGQGRVVRCRSSDDTYVVQLPFGKAYLRPTAVLCTTFPAEKSSYTSQLRAEDRSKLERPGDMLAIGTQSLYLFFRLHQILVRRLGIAKSVAFSIKDDVSLTTLVEQMPGEDSAALGRRRYDAYLSLVYALIDGGSSMSGGGAAEGGKYEDRVRCLLGHGGYELATMDKLISHILKNLQTMANDDTMWNLVQLFRRHLDSSGGFKPDAFRQEASYLSDGETMYAFQQCPVNKDGDGNKSVLHIEYLGVIAESEEEDNHLNGGLIEVEEHHAPGAKRTKREK